ncbi:hypothetical protein ACO1O0_000620 [Amphichorda felina]
MDHARDLSQIDLDDQLFQTFFDWPAYIHDTEPWDKPSTQDLDKLLTEIPPLISRFVRMKTSFGSDDGAASSEYSSHPSPPELVQGEGSTSPSDHSGPVLPEHPEEPHPRPRISLNDVRAQDDHWTYPQTDPSKGSGPGHVPQLRVLGDGVARYAAQGSHLTTVPSGRTHGKRPRQLENPDQTADVRKSGACLPCRLSKTRTAETSWDPTNTSLTKPDADVWSRNPEKELAYGAQTRRFDGKPKPISVFFSNKPGSPALSAYVQPYRWEDENEDSQLEKAAFSSEHPISYEMLQQWVEQELETPSERKLDFPRVVQKFLMAYARDGYGLPKHDLVRKVHRMACFFRIWKTPSFWCRDPSGKTTALPISVQAQLRTIVQRGIHSFEHDILKELDSLITPSHQPKPDDKLALWACLWQLMIIYRDLTAASEVWLARHDRRPNDPLAAAIHNRYKYLLEHFFPLVAIFYHYQFRTKKSLELSADWLREPKFSSGRYIKAIETTAGDLLDCRKKFLQSLQESDKEIDRFLCIFVVNHEIKKLNARKRAPKSSKPKASAPIGDGDCDEDVD